jgi:Tfp pilus assembly protein PilF
MGDLTSAEFQLRRALEKDPNLVNVRYNLGFALQLQGKMEEAIEAYRQALQIDPDRATAHNNLGIIRPAAASPGG